MEGSGRWESPNCLQKTLSPENDSRLSAANKLGCLDRLWDRGEFTIGYRQLVDIALWKGGKKEGKSIRAWNSRSSNRKVLGDDSRFDLPCLAKKFLPYVFPTCHFRSLPYIAYREHRDFIDLRFFFFYIFFLISIENLRDRTFREKKIKRKKKKIVSRIKFKKKKK